MKTNGWRTLSFSISIFAVALSLSHESHAQSGSEEATTKLKDVSSFPIGSSMSTRHYLWRPDLAALHVEQFNSVTAGNAMKMHFVAREPGGYDFGPADQMLAFAEENDQRLFGHTLIWHSATPDWVEDLSEDPEALDAFMKDYIHTYVGRYKGKVAGWDVVNEAMNTSGPGYRQSVWYRALGKDYIAKAFTYAHEADPEAVLFYNDFNIERDMEKLDTALEMISDLTNQGVPISGLGFQMHLRMDIPDETIAEALRKGAATGLQIHLSEVDIIFNRHDDTRGGGEQIYSELTDEMREQQAEKYRNLVLMYRRIIPEEQQFGITFWGFSDGSTWIPGFFGMKDWPCIFDEELNPKPAFYGFKEGLEASLSE
ncbi:endo-1,4-beta-xylanase [Pelagicoccus sp. SDUM812002]|uniref:endo-1,4-beta-xylanase n=1 Tax=Pelagicoccus sp. SDUM812002 TaxID=3041266 RepID=UPI00280E8D05|nr:endo-1,4-beta-xylanase [Pelagicoccus sp. SDUM812002]MDQ8187966.1 endo-1,4-beta-xylanase [Pelagicoccus sp. SDUM812002]